MGHQARSSSTSGDAKERERERERKKTLCEELSFVNERSQRFMSSSAAAV
jgi:hypothetical protein